MAEQLLISELHEDAEMARAERHRQMQSCDITGRGLAAVHGDPSSYREVVGIDFGGGTMHWYALLSERQGVNVPLCRAVDVMLSFERNTLVIAEASGFRPQTPKSLAQPLTEAQIVAIRDMAQDRGIDVRLYPQDITTRARCWAAIHSEGLVDAEKTDDLNDAKALAFYVRYCNGVALARIPTSFDSVPSIRLYAREVISRSNITLAAIKSKPDGREIFPGLISIAEKVFDAFRMREYEPITRKTAISLVALVASEIDGQLVRFVRHGKPPGVDAWLKEVALCRASHHEGGIARANIYHDQFRPFMERVARGCGLTMKHPGKPTSYIPFGQHTPEQDACRRLAHKLLRRSLKDAYRAAVQLTADLPAFEVLTAMEATDGR